MKLASLAGLAAILLSGCAPQAITRTGRDVQGLYNVVLVMATIVFAAVEIAIIWQVVKYRRRRHQRVEEEGLPPQIHGNTLIEVIWTSLPAIVLAFILVPTVRVIFETQAPAPANAMPVEVIGHQFWWEFRYPEANVVTANELHLPMGRTANLILKSDDVIHSFWIPALGGKRDAFPGHTNHLWMTPNAAGTYPGQCYQLCGYSHGNMRERAVVESQADFDTWLRAQQQPAAEPPAGEATEGAQVFQQKGCSGCHTIEGTSAQGKVGPNLTHIASRQTLAGAVLENTPQDLRTWLRDPPAVKPGSIMPNLRLNDHELDVLVAYLQSLR
jgi:cytochrome c oxidase subunit 2